MASAYAIMKSVRAALNRLGWALFPPRWKPAGDDLTLGWTGENAAARFLRTRGFKILVRRFRSRHGEIDLVCRDADTLVFVEVKTREDDEAVRPSDAVGPDKQLHISRAALDYLRRLGHPEVSARFDIVEVIWSPPRPRFELISDAFPLAESRRP